MISRLLSVLVTVTLWLAQCMPAWDHIQTEQPSEGQEVPYYHFPMLNDATRNDAFYEGLKWAFAKKQKEGKRNLVVLDVGAGFMLLSMMAAELGAKEVIAIERNPLVADVGRQIIHRNRMNKKIQVIVEDSAYLTKNEIPTIPDILVSETLDSWIIGEGFLTKLNDLKNRGLISRETVIVPSRGKLYMQLVQSAYSLPANSSVHHFNFDPLFSLKPFTHMVLREQNVQLNLSEPLDAFQFDFQGYFPSHNPHDHIIYPYPNGIFDIQRFEIPIITSGMLHGAVFWFNISMDGDDSFHMHNAPESKTHWRPMLCLFGEDYIVSEGSTVRLEVARLSERFTFAVDSIYQDEAILLAPKQRHIMVYHRCDNVAYEIFIPRYDAQVRPVDDDFVLNHSMRDEYNVIVATVGQTIRAVNTETLQYVDYLVEDDADESLYASDFTQLPVFYVGECPLVGAESGRRRNLNNRQTEFAVPQDL